MFILQACVPYFEMLEKWIYKGIIQDPYAEVWNSNNSNSNRSDAHVIVHGESVPDGCQTVQAN